MIAQPTFADDVDTAIENLRGAGDFIDDAYGYVVSPSIGKGEVFVGGKKVGKKTSQITYGLQLGGQVYSQMIFFRDERTFYDFTSGNFEFGALGTAVALTAGAQASTTSRSGMATFTIAKAGLMFEAMLRGPKFKYEPR